MFHFGLKTNHKRIQRLVESGDNVPYRRTKLLLAVTSFGSSSDVAVAEWFLRTIEVGIEIDLEGSSLLQEMIVDGVDASEGFTIIMNDSLGIPLDAGA